MLISTQPQNEGERAALTRSHQLTELVWTPVRDIPTYIKNKNCVLPAGVPVKGFPYASTEKTDKFITENGSIRTVLSSIKNPHSKSIPGAIMIQLRSYRFARRVPRVEYRINSTSIPPRRIKPGIIY